MFDLEQSIAEWRKQMLAAGIKSPVPLEELEAHLREEVEQQLRNGISVQAAFNAAVGRLGRADVLRKEFKQGRFDIRFLGPIYVRMYCFLVAPLMTSLIWTFPDMRTSSVWDYASILAILLMTLYVAGLPFFYRQLFTWQNRLMCVAVRAGTWFAAIWIAFALLSSFVPIQIGNAATMIGWSVYAAVFATVLACANYEREYLLHSQIRVVNTTP
jgi:hypothetical protein